MNRILLSLMATLALTVSASAVPITFTVQGTATGLLSGVSGTGIQPALVSGSTPFTNAPFTITLATDTASIAQGGGFSTTPGVGASLSITGIGSGTFTNLVQLQTQNGVQTASLLSILGFTNAAFASYNLTSALGPLSVGSGSLPSSVPTSLGFLTFTSVAGLTFQATPSGPSPVPAPPTLILSLAGLGAFAIYQIGRRRRAVRT